PNRQMDLTFVITTPDAGRDKYIAFHQLSCRTQERRTFDGGLPILVFTLELDSKKSGGMFHFHLPVSTFRRFASSYLLRNRAFDHAGRSHTHGTQNADGFVDAMGNEGAGANQATIPRGSHQAH